MTKGYSRIMEILDEYLQSKIWLHNIPKIYILDNLENDLHYILNYLCCCILSIDLSMLYILIWRKDNSVVSKIDEDDDDASYLYLATSAGSSVPRCNRSDEFCKKDNVTKEDYIK